MMVLAGNGYKPTIMEPPCSLYQIFQWNHFIRVPMKKQHRLLEAVDSVLHMDGLGYANIITAQRQTFHHADFLGNVQRIKANAQQAALSGTTGGS